MRKIFNIIETTLKPCLAEKKDVNDINADIDKTRTEMIRIQSALDESNEDLRFSVIKINSHSYAIEKEQEYEVFLLNKNSTIKDEININCGYIPSFSCYYSEQKLTLNALELVSSRERMQKLQKDLKSANDVIEEANVLIPELEKDQKDEDKKLKKLQKELENAQAAYKACRASKDFSQSFNLKLNPSCKEIKQKIKIVNQKRISIKHKSLDLRQGIDSLPILNINKKLSDKKIKNTKELIVKLDKLNPIIFISKKLNNITPDFSIYAIYKKVKDDLASYQAEGKALEAKIKNLKEKPIKDKKIRLETKFSKLIKKFKNC